MDIQGIKADLAARTGIRPLPVHVGAVFAEYMKNPALAERLQTDMTAMVAGIARYMNHPFRRTMPPLETVWTAGQARLLFCPPEGETKASVLLVPSLINRSAILDLLPGRSFVRWLAGQDYGVYQLDWGEPVRDDAMATLDGVIGERLVPAMDFLRAHTGGPVHGMGYCMGGTLLAAGAMLAPETLRSAVFLASPWDFHAGDRVLTGHVQAGMGQALQMIEAEGKLPADWIQSVFAVISADKTVGKFSAFATLDQDSEQARLFVAVEDWLNDGVDFPGAMARSCLMDWYGTNRPGRGEWKAAGRIIDPAQLKIPALVVASAADRLVPADSSLAMAALLSNKKVMQPAIGHIGMMSGKKAQAEVWAPIAAWLDKIQ